MRIGLFCGGPLTVPANIGTVSMTDLPRPTVEVEHEHVEGFGDKLKVTSTGPTGGNRSYEASRATVGEAVKDVIEQIYADPATAERLPPVKKP